MNFVQEARKLITNLDNHLYQSAYDTAWMARVNVRGNHHPQWPELTTWLLEHQWEDGSWGGIIPYRHDRILCTLSAIITLKINQVSNEHQTAIQCGEAYLWKNLHFLHEDLMELVAFELLLPTFLEHAQKLGLHTPTHTYGYGEIRDKKLSLLPLELIYKPGTSLAFSLEYLGDNADLKLLHGVQAQHGGISNSPATTAYLAVQSESNAYSSLEYLNAVNSRPHGIPSFHPFDTFEAAWVLEHLHFGGLDLKELADLPVWKDLQNAFTATGVGIDPSFGINDGDTTSVASHVLGLAGFSPNSKALQYYEVPEKRTFRTFDFERNMSVITNIHALEALYMMPDYPERKAVQERVIAALLSRQIYQTFWVDKWHISPYYATSHALLALMKYQEYKLIEYSHAIEWIVHTQRTDGSWGFFDRGTYEETAYALLALLHYYHHTDVLFEDGIKRGMEYLAGSQQGRVIHPELWVAKTLYTPEHIVNAAIIATFALYENLFG